MANFKSFKAEQTIEFGERNIIIGKNGSGKSNLLSAISAIFLLDSSGRPQYNDNEGASVLKIDIYNSARRFPLPDHFTLSAVFKERVEYYVNDRLISREELGSLLENAGFSRENIVAQGTISAIGEMAPSARHAYISRIAGVARYEESRAQALRYLDDGNEEKITGMLERIDLKTRRSEEYERRLAEYERLRKRKAEVEYELMCWEVKELNNEIEGMVTEERPGEAEQDEGLIDYEIKESRAGICKIRDEIAEIEEYLNRYDRGMVEQIARGIGDLNKENAGNTNDSEKSINVYNNKVKALEQERNKKVQLLEDTAKEETEAYVYLKALKYLDAMGEVQEDPRLLEAQAAQKRREIEDCRRGHRPSESLPTLIAARKQLWIRERALKTELKELEEAVHSHNNRMLYLGKQSINIFESIKEEDGVFGTVFSLFSVPSEIVDAYEAVTQNSHFWVVVRDADVATRLAGKVEGRTTFLALDIIDQRYAASRSKQGTDKSIEDERLIRLSKLVRCDKKYRSIAELICKDFYICPDIELALQLSEKYHANMVTLEGDLANKSGSITGGYEQTNTIMRELRQYMARAGEARGALRRVAEQLIELGTRIRHCEMAGEDEGRALENLMAVEKYLGWKIALAQGQKIKVRETAAVEAESRRLQERIPMLRLELAELEDQLAKYASKRERMDQLIGQVRRSQELGAALAALMRREQTLIDSMYASHARDTSSQEDSVSTSIQRQRKYMLIDKRSGILKKLGVSDFRSLAVRNDREGLVRELKALNSEMKGYYGLARQEAFTDAGAGLRAQLEGLRGSREKIVDFMARLDQRKEETFFLTFSMISANYAYFYRQITGGASELLLNENTVDISIDGTVTSLALLSGGQKTVIALCLLFAVHKNDPAPFYVFDEIDANLDSSYRVKVYEIIRETDAQYFITSFKEESLRCGDHFFGVAVDNKASFVGEIDAGLAAETIKY